MNTAEKMRNINTTKYRSQLFGRKNVNTQIVPAYFTVSSRKRITRILKRYVGMLQVEVKGD